MKQILEGSRAIALTIKNIKPAVISAYPITPQTHIVEDLAKFKADGEADYEYVRAESEFAAASIIEGASAAGVRVYTATSSQGLLLMAEVVFNIAGMRLPIVMTCANRGVSAPITIWNDHQDAMTVRDAGWVMLFAENHQEAVDQHIMAYKIAEQTNLPVIVNVDGFVLTHTYDSVVVPDAGQIKKYLPDYKPKKGQYLDTNNPVTMGAFAAPAYYMEIRQELHDDLVASLDLINEEYKKYHEIITKTRKHENTKTRKHENTKTIIDNGLVEYYGSSRPKVILVAMGSVVGTIKDAVDKYKYPISLRRRGAGGEVGVLKIKSYRPFPADEIVKIIKKAKYIAVLDKAITLGEMGPLASDIKAAAQGKIKAKIQSFIVGLGGRDITGEMVERIIKEVKKGDDGVRFVG
ncbi:pyruvate ferredoxin oxidoreductase [Patescibacteria group bacterium]|nr:pyruvate ferredoxin oxidoreductase [Candidatus Falkowbacteria bacterium]MBU3906230.1 pyruvate ferredoxin oxidoreductase [Patescibacteria group bacterium]MBU4026859.1 pyruvate ferredoxin oxidoreductase [Patescibacteria group bacterium]MBU4073423.1 pyruvate ferredoxin oxidoreductase [Patescibacteria group bacterium]MBU4103059.1 pyruvate ferredoxin oxidoreductase [Patescibacteria group bacterium]